MKKRDSATIFLLTLALAAVARPVEPHNVATQPEASSLVDIVRRDDCELTAGFQIGCNLILYSSMHE